MSRFLCNSFVLLFLLLNITSCETSSPESDVIPKPDTVQNPITPVIESLTIQSDKSKIIANGTTIAKISVLSDKGENVTASCKLYSNDTLLTNSSFATNTSNIYKIKAVYDTLISNSIEIQAYKNNIFTAKNNLIVEDYTATWCGYCPRVAYKLNDVSQSDDRIIPIAIHISDAYEIKGGVDLSNAAGIRGIPTAYVSRGEVWDENYSFFASYFSKNATSAIAIESKINGSNVEVKAKIKVSDPINKQYSVAIYITEDSILTSQSNYYNDGRGNPIKNFVNNHLLRYTGSEIFGSPIAASSFTLEGEFEKSATIPISPAWIKKNCDIVVFISDQYSNKIENAQRVKLGENKYF